LKIQYHKKDLEDLCAQPKLATRKLGAQSAKKLQTRLNELFAVDVVTDLSMGRPHPLEHDRAGEFAVDLHKGTRLIFKPSQQPPPKKNDGSIDWAQVAEITIIGAEDYHD
jgi:toxin HigB-1